MPALRLEFRLEPDVEADASAAFGQATVSLTPRVAVTAGLRYTHERKTIDNTGGLYTVDAPMTLSSDYYSYTDAISHDAWTPKFGVEVRARENVLAYASATRGFKSGGFNATSTAAGRGYDPEWAWSYEGGVKTAVRGGRARLNVAAFHTDYTDLQVQTPITTSLLDVSNAAAATIRGFELEATTLARPPVQAGGHLAWLDATYDRYLAVGPGGATVDVAGNRLNNSPEWSGRMWIDWTRAIGRASALSLRADSTWKSTVFYTPFNDSIQRQGPLGLLDISAEFGADTPPVVGRGVCAQPHQRALHHRFKQCARASDWRPARRSSPGWRPTDDRAVMRPPIAGSCARVAAPRPECGRRMLFCRGMSFRSADPRAEPRVRRLLSCLLWLTIAFASSSAAQSGARQVLLLNSFERGSAVENLFASMLRAELGRQSSEPVNFFEVSLQPALLDSERARRRAGRRLPGTRFGQRLDLVVTLGGPAAEFAQRYRERIFPATPLLLAAMDQRWVEGRTLAVNETAVAAAMDPSQVIEDILRLLPDTTSIFVVIGASPIESFWRNELGRRFQPFENRLKFVWSNDLSFEEMLKRAADASAALRDCLLAPLRRCERRFTRRRTDAGRASRRGERSDVRSLRHPAGPRHRRRFAALGRGRGSEVGQRRGADPARRVAGRHQDGPVHARATDVRLARAPALGHQRSAIARGEHRPVSTAERVGPIQVIHRRQWLCSSGCRARSSARLIVQRTRRRRTELALRKSERQFRQIDEQNHDLAGRLINAQEAERARIARDLHDDVSQQLAGVSIAFSGLKRRLDEYHVSEDVRQDVVDLQQQTHALARNVRQLSHDLHPTVLRHLGLVKALTAYCGELERAHGVVMKCSAEGEFASVAPDAALCVYRIAQEALRNVVAHAGAGCAEIRLVEIDDHLEITITDNGQGFDVTPLRSRQRSGTGKRRRACEDRGRHAQHRLQFEAGDAAACQDSGERRRKSRRRRDDVA